jgi:uncharacterized membrane protein YdfJ with MMPL/SSD domain
MQTLLQDVTEYLPIMGGLSPPMRHELQQHLVPLLHVITGLAVAFILVAIAILVKFAATATFIPFFMILFSPFLMILPNRKNDTSTANIKFGKLKVSWQGGLAVGFLVLGVLLLILVKWVKA